MTHSALATIYSHAQRTCAALEQTGLTTATLTDQRALLTHYLDEPLIPAADIHLCAKGVEATLSFSLIRNDLGDYMSAYLVTNEGRTPLPAHTLATQGEQFDHLITRIVAML